jgi:DNA-binding GntR family transcriptional regulator
MRPAAMSAPVRDKVRDKVRGKVRDSAMIEPLPVQLALVDLVHDRLVTAIADGTLKPGQRITQDDIATRLGVSRQPVSHALQVLRRRGLLVDRGRRGLVVAPLDARRLRELYQLRAVLDGLAASLAATRVRAGGLSVREREQGRALLARGTALVVHGTVAELVTADVEFHSMVYRWSGNRAIIDTVAEAWPHFMRSMGAVLANPEVRERIWGEHEKILDLVLAGEPAAAEAAARHHTWVAGEETAASLERAASVA